MSFWVSPVSASELQAAGGHLGEGGGGEEQGELASQAAAPELCYHHAQRLELGGAEYRIEVVGEDPHGEPDWGVQAVGVG